MNGAQKGNYIFFNFISILKQAMPHLVKQCPYAGRLEILNFTLNFDLLKYVTRGIFKFDEHHYSDEDENVFSMISTFYVI